MALHDINGSYTSSESEPLIGLKDGPTRKKGLTVITCALFIVGEMAGSGVLALPKAIVDAGWTGIALLVICCLLSLYCGILLGRCWTILQNRNHIYRSHVRDPYSAIGFETLGKPGKYLVEFCLLVTLFGVCVVFLLLASNNISSLVNRPIGNLSPDKEFRLWLLICAAAMLPFCLLGTPKDIWPLAMLASCCTGAACVCIIVKSGIDYSSEPKPIDRGTVDVVSFFAAFGTIAFSFGGATLFPTYQTDMRDSSQFPKAAILGFIGVFIMYAPTCIVPFFVYGNKLNSNVLDTLKDSGGSSTWLVKVSQVLITFHLLFTLVITSNPISQQIEEYFHTPKKFCWQRNLIRVLLMLCILGFAEAIPSFGPILGFIGGSTVTMMAFILPCICYMILNPDLEFYMKVFLGEIILVSCVSGGASIYSAILGLIATF